MLNPKILNRFGFIYALWVGLSVGLHAGDGSTPDARFKPLPVGEVRPAGWLQQLMEIEVTSGYAPVLPELTPYVTLETFNAAAKSGMEKPPIGAVWWSGEQTGCWLDGYIRGAYLSGNEEAIGRVDALVKRVLSYQEDDGYLGVYARETRYPNPIEHQSGELWAQATLFRGLLAYYELTGREDVLDAVKKAVDLSISKYGPDAPYWRTSVPRGGPPHSLMFIDICEWLHRLTGDAAYVDFSQFLYDSYNEREDVFEYDVLLRNLADREKLFNGHGVHVLEHVRVPYFLYYVTGDEKYAPVQNYPEKIERHLNAGGAVICDEDIRQRLGSPDIGAEFCTMQELEHSMQSVLQKTGDAQAGDWIERVAFNASQGARMKDGSGIAYLSADNQPEASVARGHGGRYKYSPTHEDVALCCVNWAVRMYPYYVDGMWMKTADGRGLATGGYGPCVLETTINGKSVRIEEATNYPFEETVVFTVSTDASVRFPIYLRIPEWSKGSVVIAKGAKITEEDGYVCVEKKWRSGDRIELRFEAEVERHDLNGGGYYWTRGPLTYALPIPSVKKAIRDYDCCDFADYDVLREADVPDYVVTSDCAPFVFNASDSVDSRDWEQPGLWLEGELLNMDSGEKETVRLVPQGTALLRQTTFKDASLSRHAASPKNLALGARVEASSVSGAHPALGLVDGKVSGYPKAPAAEWASKGETTGAKVRLSWEQPIVIENVWLFDRPNNNDWVQAVWINFSDGSYAQIDGFDNAGLAPAKLNFPEKNIEWMEVIVTRAAKTTRNIGFSEIAVFKDEPESD